MDRNIKLDSEIEQRPTPRRTFFTAAAAGLTSLVAGATGLSGCNRSVEGIDESPDASDLNSLRAVDPKLVKYREVNKIETGLSEARNVTVGPDQSVFAVGDNTIRRFEAGGKPAPTITMEGEPMCLAASADGLICVGLVDHVELLDQDGRKRSTWPSLGPNARITAVVVTETVAWVADAGSRRVVRYDLDGRILGRIGVKSPETGYPGLVIPSPHLDVVPIDGGRVLVSNPGMHRIETHSTDGHFISSWGEASNSIGDFCGCCNPTDFARFVDGRLVTSEKGIPRVKTYSADGRFEAVVAGPDVFASNTMGIDLAVDARGRVLVLDPKQKTIRIFEHV